MTQRSSRNDSRRQLRRRLALTWMLGALVASVLIAGLVLLARPQTHVAPSAGASAAPAGLRVVQLTTAPDAASSDTQTIAVLLAGAMPRGTVKATVTSDENCAPDAQGYSHCSNDLRLPDGSVLHLRHNHPMATVACLAPGEKVLVRRA